MASDTSKRYPPGDDARTASNYVVDIGTCGRAGRTDEQLVQDGAFQRVPARAGLVEENVIADGKGPKPPVERLPVRVATNLVRQGGRLAFEKIGKLRTLVADPSMNFIDGKIGRANQANRGAHHTPVVLSARQKHATGSAGPGHLDNALVQPAKNLVSPRLNMSAIGLVHHALVELQGRARTAAFFPEQARTKSGGADASN